MATADIVLDTPLHTDVQPHPVRWSIDQYYRLHDLGFFEGRRVELLDGEIIEMSPIGNAHWIVVDLIQLRIHKALPDGYFVHTQNPLRMLGSMPQPDVCIIPGDPRSFYKKDQPPATAALVIEVSDTSLQYDRTDKLSLYASHGIRDYWIVNLNDNCIEVYRDPVAQAGLRFGWTYANRTVAARDGEVAALEIPVLRFHVRDLLP